MNIEDNPRIGLSLLSPLLKAVAKTGKAHSVVETFYIHGYDYTLRTRFSAAMENGSIYLTIDWTRDREFSQKIEIIQEESNLVKGSYVYYFLVDGYKSRKIYYVGGIWKSRRAFRHLYAQQGQSRLMREFQLLNRENPYTPKGKEYYRGKITPYGKRLKRYNEATIYGIKRVGEFLNRTSKRIKES